MERKDNGTEDGTERRSGTDRRKGDRRDPTRQKETGVLSTRLGERRRPTGRRAANRKEQK